MTAAPGACPEVSINGERHRLRLTLGALAAIEDVVGGGDFETLKARLSKPSVSDLIIILQALITGGGGALAVETLKAADIDLAEASAAIADAFKALAQPPQHYEAPAQDEAPA